MCIKGQRQGLNGIMYVLKKPFFPSLVIPCDPSNKNCSLPAGLGISWSLLVTIFPTFPQKRSDCMVRPHCSLHLSGTGPTSAGDSGAMMSGVTCSNLSSSLAFGGREVLFRREREEIPYWPWVKLAFFYPALPAIKLIPNSCVYFSKGEGFWRETARVIYYYTHVAPTRITGTCKLFQY